MSKLIKKFIRYCDKYKIVFENNDHNIFQFQHHWQVCMEQRFTLLPTQAKDYLNEIKKCRPDLFPKHFFMRNRFPGFLKYCDDKKIVFFRNLEESISELVKTWRDYFDIDIEMTQAVHYMKQGNFETSYNYAPITEQELEFVAKHFAEEDLYYDGSLQGVKPIMSFWYNNFNKYIWIGNYGWYSYATDKPFYDGLNFHVFDKRVREYKKLQKSQAYKRIYTYCQDNKTVLSYKKAEAVKQIQQIWFLLFETNLSEYKALEYRKVLRDQYPECIEKKKQLAIPDGHERIYTYCQDNKTVLSYKKAEAIKQIQQIWFLLFETNLSEYKALEYRKVLRDQYSECIEKKESNQPIYKRVGLDEVYQISEIEREEMLVIFGEYCQVRSLSFSYNENDADALLEAWRRCFGI